MAAEEIITAIDEEADENVRAIIGEAQKRAGVLRDQAEARAAAERDRLAHARDDESDEAAARVLNRARLEADRTLRSAQDALFREALDLTRQRLAGLRQWDEYDAVFSRLLDEGLSALKGADRVEVAPADSERARMAGHEKGIDLAVDATVESAGGMRLSTSDGRAFDNLLESRLLRAEPWLRSLAITICPELAEGLA
jgi:vacuolar-type H+-ATPase subunit E/Vma4